MRTVEELTQSGLEVIHFAFIHRAVQMAPMFSGGHDSLCATHIASQHPEFTGDVHHIDTGIGASYTRNFVEGVCNRFGWCLVVHKSKDTFEKFVRERGFPGPGAHGWVYNRLKGRCVQEIVKGRKKTLLITGCRQQESVRRMGHVQPLKIGETSKKTGKVQHYSQIWTSPCYDWSKAEQQLYMDEMGLPINKMKIAVGMSLECCCGAFAQPGEIELLREHAPDVATEIQRLSCIARECGKHCIWGSRPSKQGGASVAETGPMCSSCDLRAAASGLIIIQN